MLWHLYMAMAMLSKFPRMYTHFCPILAMLPSPASNALKVELIEKSVLKDRTAIMMTIIMGKIEIVFPDIHIIITFIGTLKAEIATLSHLPSTGTICNNLHQIYVIFHMSQFLTKWYEKKEFS